MCTQWDIGYAKTWEDASLFLDNLYSERPPMGDFLEWRDERVMDEVYWYGVSYVCLSLYMYYPATMLVFS